MTVQPFSDPISGGGILVQPEIRSPNFVPGVSGWIIRADGTAEFHGITVSGGSVVVAGSGQGVFVYTGTPGPGNPPVASMTSGTADPYGNPVVPVISTYNAATGVILNLADGLMKIGTSASIAGGLAAYVASAAAAGGILTLDSGKQTALDQDCQVQIQSAAVAGGVPTVNVLGNILGDGQIQASVAAGTSIALAVVQTGDTFNRWRVRGDGRVSWGTGGSALDVALFRSSAGVLETDGSLIAAGGVSALAATPSGAPPAGAETWNSLGSLLGYSVTEGRYKLTPENEVVIDIEVTANGVNSSSVAFANVLPAAYRPLADRHLPLSSTRAVTAADPWPRLFVTAATGAVSILQQANTTATLGTNVRLPLD